MPLLRSAKRVLFAAAMAVCLWTCPAQASDPFTAMGVAAVTPPEPAGEFTLPGLGEAETRLADHAGKVVILNFWATWCIPCREELPHLESLWQSYREQGLVVLAVSEDTGSAKRVRKFVRKQGFTFPVALDRKGAVGRAYQASSLPASILIDRSGNIVGRVVGFRDWTGADAHALIQTLLQTPR